MSKTSSASVNPSVYLIADHLDAVLSHGEDLLALPVPKDEAPDSKDMAYVQQRLTRQRAYFEEIRAIETRLVIRIIRAREHAEQVRRADSRFKMMTDLFVSGTHVVADASADLADSTSLDFNTGRDSMAYLRSRGMIPIEALTLPRIPDLKITETFQLCGAIELVALLDLAAAYLDALELHYELYGENAAKPVAAAIADTTKAGAVPIS